MLIDPGPTRDRRASAGPEQRHHVYRHHIELDYDFATVVGTGDRASGPARPMGAAQRVARAVGGRAADGRANNAEPGRSVGLLPGTRIHIGSAIATIEH